MHRSIPSLRKCCLTLLRHDRSSHFAVIEDVSVNTHQQRPPLRAESYFQSAALLNARWQEQGYMDSAGRALSAFGVIFVTSPRNAEKLQIKNLGFFGDCAPKKWPFGQIGPRAVSEQ